MELAPDVVPILVDRLFAPDERGKALEYLDRYEAGSDDSGAIRVRVAVLKLCGGKLAELERPVEEVRHDFRDVLAWAEYPDELRQRTWRMPEADVARIRAEDRAQYLAWLTEHMKVR